MSDGTGKQWLGLEQVDENRWRLPVTSALASGASALMGGCATAAAMVVSQPLATQSLVFASTHFGALAPIGSVVELVTRVVSAGRTMTHVEVAATFGDRESFQARCTAGERPGNDEQRGTWVEPIAVPAPEDCAVFEHPVHAATWAARFEWRLAGRTPPPRPAAAWWVRSLEPADPLVVAAVLVDYVTYGMGRGLGVPMGGLSIDNVVRIRRLPEAGGWVLLEVRPEAVEAGFGHGTARLYSEERELLVTGTQSTVVNGWDWRLETER